MLICTGLSRREIIHKYAQYAAIAEKKEKKARRALIKPIWNIFHGEHNGRLFRIKIEELMRDDSMPVSDVMLRAMTVMSDRTLDGRSVGGSQPQTEAEARASVLASM